MAGLVVFLTGSVSEAAVLRARSASFDKQADAEWGDRPVHGKGGVHAGGRPTDARAYVQDLLAGIDDPGDVNPEMDGVVNLLKSTPMKDLLDVVKPEIDKMETQILDAKASAQNTLDGIDAAITTCKSNQSAGEGQASGLQTTMNGKRQPHKDCRGVENSDKIEYDSCVKTMDALKTTMDLACDAYNTAVKPPNVNLVPSPNANEEYKLWLGRVKTWVDAEVSLVGSKQAACNTARSNYENEKHRCEGPSGDGGLKKAWQDKKTQCDEAQTAFETATCEYFSKVEGTCSAYETCVAATETVYDNQRPHIESEEKDRETEYRTVQRIKCLLDVWGAQGDSVNKAKLQECVGKTHSTSHLELSYPAPPVVPSCALPERPCTPGFVSAEYGSMPAHAPNKACTPCAGAASTPAGPSAQAAFPFAVDSGTYNGITGFVKFNWAEPGAAYPAGADPLGEELGSGGCVQGSKLCRGRIPTSITPKYLLSKKSNGDWALWQFDGSTKAEKILKAMQEHTHSCSPDSDGIFDPIAKSDGGLVICGGKCDVFSYNDGNSECPRGGKIQGSGGSFILDDDGHWCNPAFKMGATVNSNIADDYGYANHGCDTKVAGALYYSTGVAASTPAGPSTQPDSRTATAVSTMCGKTISKKSGWLKSCQGTITEQADGAPISGPGVGMTVDTGDECSMVVQNTYLSIMREGMDASDDFTLVSKLKIAEDSGYRVIMETTGYRWGIVNGELYTWRWGFHKFTGGKVPKGQWVTVALRSKGDQVEQFIEGCNVGSYTKKDVKSPGQEIVLFAANDNDPIGSNRYYNVDAKVAYVRWYKRALTDEEIVQQSEVNEPIDNNLFMEVNALG